METNLFYQQLEEGSTSELKKYYNWLTERYEDTRWDFFQEQDEPTKEWLGERAEKLRAAILVFEDYVMDLDNGLEALD